jgi:hypothetical protein
MFIENELQKNIKNLFKLIIVKKTPEDIEKPQLYLC